MKTKLARTIDDAAPEPLVKKARALLGKLGTEQIRNWDGY